MPGGPRHTNFLEGPLRLALWRPATNLPSLDYYGGPYEIGAAVHIKSYINRFFYYQYLAQFTVVPRNSVGFPQARELGRAYSSSNHALLCRVRRPTESANLLMEGV